MDARAILAGLRRGRPPGPAALDWFARGLASGAVSDAQAGAFAMAVCLRGLDDAGRRALTLAMRDSGEVLRWDVDGPVLDKHSTGGVGDCVSLVLAPALAACGAFVPMISGRGLGHTGGTLDKLEAIAGVNVDLEAGALRCVLGQAGCAIVSAGPRIAPADRRLYAVRDVTATVESVDLITASILSKKLAAGLDGLVLDVKAGSGAFMKLPAEALALAQVLVTTANAAGCPTQALVSDMSQPLAPALGNALEVAAAMRVLTQGEGGPLADLSAALGGALLAQSGLAPDAAKGAARIARAIASGAAAERFARMIAAMGGPADFAASWPRDLPAAPVIRDVPAPRAGHLAAIDGEALGLAVVALGGGRQVEGDRIDPAVGLSGVARLGTALDAGAPLAVVHAASEAGAQRAIDAVQAAMSIAPAAPDLPPLIHDWIAP